MRLIALAALLAGSTVFAAGPPKPKPAAPAPAVADLVSGRFVVKVTGLLCTACTRAITAELARQPKVLSATADFERSELLITVKTGETLTVSELRSALRRAARRVNLRTQFEVTSVRYKPS